MKTCTTIAGGCFFGGEIEPGVMHHLNVDGLINAGPSGPHIPPGRTLERDSQREEPVQGLCPGETDPTAIRSLAARIGPPENHNSRFD
jgi:hypothetical protein